MSIKTMNFGTEFCSKNPKLVPGIWDFFGILPSGFFGRKKFQIPGIWELGSQKNPILKPPLVTQFTQVEIAGKVPLTI